MTYERRWRWWWRWFCQSANSASTATEEVAAFVYYSCSLFWKSFPLENAQSCWRLFLLCGVVTELPYGQIEIELCLHRIRFLFWTVLRLRWSGGRNVPLNKKVVKRLRKTFSTLVISTGEVLVKSFPDWSIWWNFTTRCVTFFTHYLLHDSAIQQSKMCQWKNDFIYLFFNIKSFEQDDFFI